MTHRITSFAIYILYHEQWSVILYHKNSASHRASTDWQIKGVRSVGRPKRRWRDDTVGQQGTVWKRTAKDRESLGLWRRTTSCSRGTQPRMEQNRDKWFWILTYRRAKNQPVACAHFIHHNDGCSGSGNAPALHLTSTSFLDDGQDLAACVYVWVGGNLAA